MTVTVIIIIAAVIYQVLTTHQALSYAVYMNYFPKMATAIYLLLHVLLTLHHWHSFFPSYGGLCPLPLNLSGHLWVSWPREFDKSDDAMCALKSLQLSLSLSLRDADLGTQSPCCKQAPTTWGNCMEMLQLTAPAGGGVPTSTAKHVQDSKMSPTAAAISLQLHSGPWARNTLASLANL